MYCEFLDEAAVLEVRISPSHPFSTATDVSMPPVTEYGRAPWTRWSLADWVRILAAAPTPDSAIDQA